ncbi:MAG: conjugal transfer protein TraR [Deltaproteobacteria bacterium GWA2_38_16]|nr:MAG: conjugal transfer protein TraR [Deltaproteobacteria bacterium GWA2_38_16]OGQ02899.1 MAG: conjugal transfer protein TraR [Deltaproteobacteria bacterium RIFCSPHIGHO2_02_FULL_38_15]OGQ35087.1 MAG: conjugal transfer protein TraR [Deltaproteobacteria bacterium RIFCSPLOWO2_01_FULL_38_9]HBQ21746.1 conjugal transfer protein TraR [Deltaproteobacteria bacterium]
MKKKDLERFKERLLNQKKQILESSMKVRTESLNVSNDDLPDEIDLASAELTKSVMLRLNDRERAILPKITKALELINNGQYGVCEACGDDIGLSRLEVRPFATLCIKCKEEEEHKEKMYASS